MLSELSIGDIVTVNLPGHVPPGHEQIGSRPALVVGMPSMTGPTRYPTLMIAPLTSKVGPWSDSNPVLYPLLRSGMGGLSRDSVVLLDNVRGLDEARIVVRRGRLSQDDYLPIMEGLFAMLDVEYAIHPR